MRKVLALGVPLSCVIAIGVPASASAEQLAASCEPPPVSESAGYAYVAEVFTSQATGNLTRTEIDVNKSAATTGDYLIELRSVDLGMPSDTVLASTTVPDASVPEGESFLNASFSAPASLAAGQKYALVIHRDLNLEVEYRGDNLCAGTAFFGGTGEFSDWSDIGGSYDVVFRAFVPSAPPTTTPPSTTPPSGQPAKKKKCKKHKKKHKSGAVIAKKCKHKKKHHH